VVGLWFQTPDTSFSKTDRKSPGKSLLKLPDSDQVQKQVEEANKALKQLQAEYTSYKKDKLENDK
jgi:TolA-binding protein